MLDGIKHYKKYLSRFAKVSYKHVQPVNIPKNFSDKDIENVKEQEGQKLLSKIKDSYVIALSPEGKKVKSESLARLLKDISIYKGSNVTFLIGGSHGLSEPLKRRSDFLLSLSPLTFPHQLTALIITEQLFRAYKINNNEPYHK